MNVKTQEAIPIFVIILSFILAIYCYPLMPDLMATHWGNGNLANAYSSKQFALFFMPILLLFLYPIFLLLPKAPPYKKSFKEFENFYNIFISLTFIFLFYVYILTLVWNTNFHFNMLQFLSPALAALIFYAGWLSTKTKRNWFVGIRTPWAFKNETVWKKTQSFGGHMFMISAAISLLGLFLPSLAVVFILVPILFSVIAVNIYSYLEAQKHQKTFRKN